MDTLVDIKIPGAKLLNSGKVREIYEADENHLLLVTTDRLSAFDVVLPDPIPEKGKVLNQISLFWFDKIGPIIKNHVVSADVNEYPEPFRGDERLKGRSVLVKKARPIMVEAIVRGYITGSGWKEYLREGSVCGIKLPAGLKESDKLPEPIFTPSTKAEVGDHDENVSIESAAEIVGGETIRKVSEAALAIYKMAADYALERGIIIADTKFEFGSGRWMNTGPDSRSPAMTSSSCVTTWKPSTGTSRPPAPGFRKRLSGIPAPNMSRPMKN